MRKNIAIVLALFFVFGFMPFNPVKAETLSNRLKGRILLQVESNGEAWYVNPKDGKRYYMANGDEAYNIMRNLGVGISNKDLEKIKNNKNLAIKYKGKIFLQVESSGEAYYVDFGGKLYYLQNGVEAYKIMKNLGLGIRNSDLSKINIFGQYTGNDKIIKTCLQQPLDLQSKCINKQAVDKKDHLVCNKIIDMDHEDRLAKIEVADCIREVAVSTSDPFLCVKVDNEIEKDYCYRMLAINLNDYTLCNHIKNNNVDNEISKAWNYNSNFNDTFYFKDACYYIIAIKRKNLTICNSIQDANTRDLCNWKPLTIPKTSE